MNSFTDRRDFCRGLLAGLSALPSHPSSPRPNIILLLLDDLGWRDFRCYGNPFHETPHIDRLAQEGVRFTDMYAACPVCSPTRASIMTGRYPARLHLTDWIPGRKQWPAARLITPSFEPQLPLAETTMAEALKKVGYQTASIGKWHLGGEGFWPEQQGFDLNVAGNHRGSPTSYFGPFDLPNLKGGRREDYLTDRLTEEAERFIEAAYRQGPFFLYFPEFAVHIPLQAREVLLEKYRRKNDGKTIPNPTYAAMIESFDQAVGRLRALLERLNIADNTILLITSDNGGLRYEGRAKEPVTDNHPLLAGKGHLYEGGIRVPLIVHWPGKTAGPRVVETPVCSIDLLPTLLEMAGSRSFPDIDGVSLVPLLRGKNRLRRDTLYWHYPHYSNQGGVPSGAVRHGDWKLMEFYEDSHIELYNLRTDIAEQNNLALKVPQKAAALHHLLQKWRTQVNAAMPTLNPSYNPAQSDQGLTGTNPRRYP